MDARQLFNSFAVLYNRPGSFRFYINKYRMHYEFNGEFNVQHYTLKELAGLYQVCKKTMRRWIDKHAPEAGQIEGRYYTSKQVAIIVMKIGVPGKSKMLE